MNEAGLVDQSEELASLAWWIYTIGAYSTSSGLGFSTTILPACAPSFLKLGLANWELEFRLLGAQRAPQRVPRVRFISDLLKFSSH